MGQVTIYLQEDIEQKMTVAAESANMSKSKWIAALIHKKVTHAWPQTVVDAAGAWDDFPEFDELRSSMQEDALREGV